METKPRGRREGSTNYPLAFKQQVAAEASESAKSVAEVAHEHGLNANMVAHWRRRLVSDADCEPIERADRNVPALASCPSCAAFMMGFPAGG